MDKSPIEISLGNSSEDFAFAYSCAKDLAEMEELHHLPSISEAQFINDGISTNPPYEVLIAKQAGRYAGAAVYYYGYSTWRGKLIYLCDLVVKEDFRKQGIARKLMEKLIEVSNENGVKVLWWHVLKWNKPALKLYESINALIDGEALSCKLGEKILNQYQEQIS